jgi:hypothetical protein
MPIELWNAKARLLVVVIATALTGCGFAPTPSGATPISDRASATASASGSEGETSASPSPTVSAEASPPAAPAAAALRIRRLPQHLETLIPGIRLRTAPSVEADVIGSLPLHGTAMAVIGPLVAGGYSWYRVSDNTGDEPTYDTAWMAVGTADDPWVTESLGWDGPISHFASFDGLEDGKFDIELEHEGYGLMWAAVGDDWCDLRVGLVSPSGERTTVVSLTDIVGLVEGQTPPDFFVKQAFIGNSTIRVTSNCSWALNLVEYQG